MTRTDIINEIKDKGYAAHPIELEIDGVKFKGVALPLTDTVTSVHFIDILMEMGETEEKIANVILNGHNKAKERAFPLMDDKGYIENNIKMQLQADPDEKFVIKATAFDGIYKGLYVLYEEIGEAYIVRMTREQLEKAGISEKRIWEIAEKNTFSDTKIESMTKIICESAGIGYEDEDVERMYVVTNKAHYNGAIAILDKTRIKEFFNAYGVKKLIVFLTSMHEVIVMPYHDYMGGVDFAELIGGEEMQNQNDDIKLGRRAYIMGLN